MSNAKLFRMWLFVGTGVLGILGAILFWRNSLGPEDFTSSKSSLTRGLGNETTNKGTTNPADMKALIDRSMSGLRQGVRTHLNLPDEAFTLETMEFMEPYKKDPEARIRLEAYRLISRIKSGYESPTERRRVLDSCVTGLDDEDYEVRRLLALGLSRGGFLALDYSDKAKTVIRNRFRELVERLDSRDRDSAIQLRQLTLVVGIAEMDTELPHLTRIIQDLEDDNRKIEEDYAKAKTAKPGSYLKSRWQSSISWAAHRAKARMGDPVAIEFCIDAVEGFPDFESRGMMFRDLAYIRQPEIVQYLREYLIRSDTFTIKGEPSKKGVGTIRDKKAPGSGYAAWTIQNMIEEEPELGDFSTASDYYEALYDFLGDEDNIKLIR